MRALKITNSITRRDEKSMEKYLTEISRFEVLTPEQEVDLFRRIKQGDQQALEKIVNHNLRFVVSVAKQYQHIGLWLGDLINEGNIGLIKAAQRFDETRGFKFISYAVWWIRQSILQAVNEKSRKIRLPQNLKSAAAKVREARRSFMQHHEREPTYQELADATEFSLDLVKRSMETDKMVTSLDAPLTTEADASLENVLADKNLKRPDHQLSVVETQQKEVQQLLKTLPPRQAVVLSMYYGIGRSRNFSLSDIGDQIGVSRERVRQIKDRAVHRLRRRSRGMEATFSSN